MSMPFRGLDEVRYKNFYDGVYNAVEYSAPVRADQHSRYRELTDFVQRFDLAGRRVLEIGCGRGAFQNLVKDYVALDVSRTASQYIQKPFINSSATHLPFGDNSFDAIWTVTVLEHVPQPELALQEMRRVLKDNGILYLAPAWQCRPWAAEGYPVRPYGDFNWKGKLIKASIPIRNSVIYRSSYIFPQRMVRLVSSNTKKEPTKFQYKRLRANYEKYWMSDSDACNSMDPFEAIIWFTSRGDKCLSHPRYWQKFLVRTGGLIFRIHK